MKAIINGKTRNIMLDPERPYILRADGSTEPYTGGDSLAAMQEAVGGYIQAVPAYAYNHEHSSEDADYVIICNEEGMLYDLPVNDAATAMYAPGSAAIVGDVIVMHSHLWMDM